MSLKPQEVDFDESWQDLEKTVTNVLSMGSVGHEQWITCFSKVYALCVSFPNSYAEQLYNAVRDLITCHVDNLCQDISKSGDESILTVYYYHWLNFSKGTKYLDSLFSYLNKQHVQKLRISDADQRFGHVHIHHKEQAMEIGELAYMIWEENLIQKCHEGLVRVLLACIQADRLNESLVAPVETVRGVINSFVDVCEYKKKRTYQLYESVFEEPLLKQTAEFYRTEGSSLLQELTLDLYMKRVIGRKQDETLRCTKFLPPSCHQKVERKVHYELVERHLDLLQGEGPKLVEDEKLEDLANMYQLLKPVINGLKPLVICFQEHIKKKGLESVQHLQGENPALVYVENLLAVHCKYSEMVVEVFKNDQCFQEAMHKAFEAVVNHRQGKSPPKSPEIIAKYCDILLKKSTKGQTESEAEDKLCNCIIIFKYLEDKDIFHKFYSRYLARRLLQQLSISMDHEELIINKLKVACGYEFTSRLHRMFTDMAVSQDHNTKFALFLLGKSLTLDTNFSVHILQAGAWPVGLTATVAASSNTSAAASVSCTMSLPVELEKPIQYTNAMKAEELLEASKIDAETFYKYLQNLIDCKLLNSSSTPITSSSVIELNLKYTNKRTKFKIMAAPIKEQQQQQEVASTHATVEEDRKVYLQAAIVRIMKMRKRMQHNFLIQEVIEHSRSRFLPQIPMIKKCIEVLLEKQYIERSQGSHDEYKYVA